MQLFIVFLFLLNLIVTNAFPIEENSISSNLLRKRNILNNEYVLATFKWGIIFVVVFLMSACCVCRRKRGKNNENDNDSVNSA
ncbi:hypothetical protein RclHR1_15420006 [Rhizophagus clarus]|nr:hypothetical protein RclHR1_15420006 [Rhizophagus clarus]